MIPSNIRLYRRSAAAEPCREPTLKKKKKKESEPSF